MPGISDMLRNTPMTTTEIGNGDRAIFRTISKIKTIVRESSKNPYVRRWAERMIGNIPPNDKVGEVRAIHDFVKTRVRYTKDPYGTEYIQTPPLLLKMLENGETPMGDCDDFVTLGMSLLRSIGFPTALKVTGYTPERRFQHIYGLVYLKNNWIPFEGVKRDRPLGWEAPNPTRVLESEI